VTAPRGLPGRHVRTDGTLWFEARCPHGVWTTWVARQVSSRVAEVATVAVPGCECDVSGQEATNGALGAARQ
jgi:hypothetical protein